MRFVRVAAAATSLLVIGAASSLGSAGAASTGVGTSTVSTSILRVQLGTDGSLLDVRLLGDDAQSTRDAKTAAAPTAFSKLTPLRATSTVLDDPTTSAPLNLALPTLESRQPGGEAEVNRSSVDLANPGVPVLTGLGDIISGTLSLAKLTSAVDTATSTAKSTMDAGLADAAVAGGLLTADVIGSTVQSTTTASESSAVRGINVDAISVLDLGAILDGLDIDITHLTPAEVSGLLDELGVSIPNVDPAATLEDIIDQVNDQIDALQDALVSGTGLINGTAGTVIDTVGLGDIVDPADITAITGTAAQQTQLLIDTLQAALAEVVAGALSALDATTLLSLDGVDVDVVTKAADTLTGSSATVTGTVGTVHVGNLSLGGLDLLATADTINTTLAGINNALSSTLSTITTPITGGAVDLSDLVSVEVLKKTTSVAEAAGYNTARASLTGLTAKITPPVDLAALVTAIKTQNTAGQSAGALIQGLGGTVPQLSSAMADLEATLGAGIQALQGGATVNVVEVAGVSEFRAIGATTGAPGTPGLAATGKGTAQLAALGVLLVALGLGLGRWFSMPAPAWVRRRF